MERFRVINSRTLYEWIKYPKISTAKYIILHDTGVDANQSVEEIDNYHRNHNGWKGIGYDIYIDKHYAYETFRFYENIRGAHCKGYNDNIGISLAGATQFSSSQYEQLCEILERLLLLNPKLKIKYHKELNVGKIDPHENLTALIDRDYKVAREL